MPLKVLLNSSTKTISVLEFSKFLDNNLFIFLFILFL